MFSYHRLLNYLRTGTDNRKPFRHMGSLFFISPTGKFMFLSVPKSACTTLKSIFYRIEFGGDFQPSTQFPSVHEFFGYREGGPGGLIARGNRTALQGYSGFLRFVVYRDPVARFLSMYHDKVLRPRDPIDFYVQRGMVDMPLDPFLDRVEEILQIPDPQRVEDHMRPQARFFDREDVDYIVPIEALDAFCAEKLGVTGVPRLNPYEGPRIRPTDRQIDRIRRLYREDYSIVPNFPGG